MTFCQRWSSAAANLLTDIDQSNHNHTNQAVDHHKLEKDETASLWLGFGFEFVVTWLKR